MFAWGEGAGGRECGGIGMVLGCVGDSGLVVGERVL